ncbi:MAG: hypothetical protein ACQEW9_18955, partial [Bacteroidota bacterium]
VISTDYMVDPAPVTPDAPTLTVPDPECDVLSVNITFTPINGVEYSLSDTFENLIGGGSFEANVGSSGTVYARTVGTECVITSDYEVDPAPGTPDAPVLTIPDPECDAETVTITFTAVDGVEYSLSNT